MGCEHLFVSHSIMMLYYYICITALSSSADVCQIYTAQSVLYCAAKFVSHCNDDLLSPFHSRHTHSHSTSCFLSVAAREVNSRPPPPSALLYGQVKTSHSKQIVLKCDLYTAYALRLTMHAGDDNIGL